MAQETKVKLHSEILNETREFNISHAEKVLKAKNETTSPGYWELKDEKFTLNENGTIEHRTVKPDKRSEAQKPDTQSS